MQKLDFKNKIPDTLEYITQAGGKLNDDTLKYYGDVCKKKKIKFYTMYGQTEASPRMTYLGWKNFFKSFGSVGKALNGCKIILQDNKKKKIKKAGVKGEIIFYGKNVCLGYSKTLTDLSRGDKNKGKLKTGDLENTINLITYIFWVERINL